MSIVSDGSSYYKYVDYLTDNYIFENNVSNCNVSISRTKNNYEYFYGYFNEQFFK